MDSVLAHGEPYNASLRLAAVTPSACDCVRPRASCGHRFAFSPMDSGRCRALSSLNTGRSGNVHASGEYGRYCQMFESVLATLTPLRERTRPSAERPERTRRRGTVAYVSVNSAPRHHSFVAVSFHSSWR